MLQRLYKAGLVALLCLSSSLASASSYSNPLKYSKGGDPQITYENGWYYLMTTTTNDLQMTRATTLEGLKSGETRQVWVDTTPNRCCAVWAPEMHKINGAWYIYYAAASNSSVTDDHRMHVLKGDGNLWDAFSFLGTVNTPGWAIDGTLLNLPTGNYFVYSCKRTDTGTELQSLCIAAHADPITIGPEHLLSQPLAPWETIGLPVNEGPYQLHFEDKTWLTFSASFCATNSYAVGLLTYNGGDPLSQNSWSKSNGAVFGGANGVMGVGHNSFFFSPDGTETWLTHHSTPSTSGDCDTNRYVNTKKITFNANGSPNFGQPLPYGQNEPSAAGEQ